MVSTLLTPGIPVLSEGSAESEYDLIESIKGLARNNPDIVVLWLYGSQAEGTATAKSDIDLAVLFQDYRNDPLERRLRPEILAIDWQQALRLPEDKLSVIDINLVPIALAFSVIDNGKVLVCKDTWQLTSQETRIMGLFEEAHYQASRYG
jgi:predicted nucleotidyltransferase